MSYLYDFEGEGPWAYTNDQLYNNWQQEKKDHELWVQACQDDMKKLINHVYGDRKLNDFDLGYVIEDLAALLNINIRCYAPLKIEVK